MSVYFDQTPGPFVELIRLFNITILAAFVLFSLVESPRVVKHAPLHAMFLYIGTTVFVAISAWGAYQAYLHEFPATLSTFLYTPASVWLLASKLVEDPANNWPGVPGFVRWLRNKED